MNNYHKENNVVKYKGFVTMEERNMYYGHKSGLVLFTGLPSSGKSTIAHHLEKLLFDKGIKCYVLDGDNIRHGLNSDLGFSDTDRKENLRRLAEVSRLFIDAGLIVMAAFVAPYKRDREFIKNRLGKNYFLEVYVKCSPEVCAKRDPKGHYEKAKLGMIKGYTGVDAPYEIPENPDLIIDTEIFSIKDSVNIVFNKLIELGWLALNGGYRV